MIPGFAGFLGRGGRGGDLRRFGAGIGASWAVAGEIPEVVWNVVDR
jgi:hypothetical protein